MELTANREEILTALNLFAGVVEHRPSDPMSVFSNLTFSPSGEGCELTATGGEIGLKSSISAEVQGEGVLSVPVGLLAAWLKECTAETVSFEETDQNWIQVRCGDNRSRIPGRVGDPPSLETPPETPLCTVSADTFTTLLRAGSYAYPTSVNASVATAGAQIEVEGDEVRIVSSDHSRLAYSSAKVAKSEVDGKKAYGLAMKALTELGRLARSADFPLRFFEKENHLFMEFGPRLLVSAKLADRLPEYEHVIPRDCPVRVRCSRAGLLAAVQAALPFASGDHTKARLEIGDERLQIDVTSVRGEAVSSVELIEAAGVPLTLNVNLTHLRDFAKSFECEFALLSFNTPESPFILRPVEEDEDVEHFCVGMPYL